MTITPKNWRDFQHYKDRNPPWIRLHKKLLDDFDFYSLPLASKALAPMLWLLASESVDGVISLTIQKIAFRVRMTESDLMDALKPLIEAGFFSTDQDASAALAECQRSAVPIHFNPETSQRHPNTEKPRAPRFDAQAHLLSIGVPASLASDWLAVRKAKRAATTLTAIEGLDRECVKAGITLVAGITMCCERGWQSLKAEWLANAGQGSPPRAPNRDELRTIAAQTRLSDIINDDGTRKDRNAENRTIDAFAPRLLG